MLSVLVAAPSPAQQSPQPGDTYIFSEAANRGDYRKEEGNSFTFTIKRRSALTGADTETVVCQVSSSGRNPLEVEDFGASATATGPLAAWPGPGVQLTFTAANWNRPQRCATLHTLDDYRPDGTVVETATMVAYLCHSASQCGNTQRTARGRLIMEVTDNDRWNHQSVRATGSGGDRDPDTPGLQVVEGDTITWIFIIHNQRTSARESFDIQTHFSGSYDAADSDRNPGTYPSRIEYGPGPFGSAGTLTQTITDDSVIEDAETVTAFWSVVVRGRTFNSAPTTVTILPSDGVEFYIDSPPSGTVFENETLNIVIGFRGIRNVFSTSLNYAVGGTATLGADYEVDAAVPSSEVDSFNRGTGAGLVRIDSHIDTVTLPIRILLDGTADPGETVTFQITGGAPNYVTFNRAVFTYTISDSAALSVTGPATVTEANRDLRYTVSYTPERSVPALTVPFTVTGTATVGGGGTASPLIFSAGGAGETLSADLIVRLVEADLILANEGTETVVIAPAASTQFPSGYAVVANPATFTTAVTDAAATAFLEGADRSVVEGSMASVFVGLQGPARTAATTAAFAITGTATAGDYEVVTRSGSPAVTFDADAATGTVEILPGAGDRGRIDLNILSDADDDEGETLIITLTSHTGPPESTDGPFEFDGSPLTITVQTTIGVAAALPAGDRDPGSAEVLDVNEGDRAEFTVTVAGEVPAGGLEVDWAISGVESTDWTTAARRDGDGGTLTFTAAGAQTVTVTAAADGLNEAAETLFFTLTDAGARVGSVGSEAAVRITESDPATYRIDAPDPAVEGGEAVFLFTLSTASEGDVTIPLTVSGAAAADAVNPPSTFTIPAGRTQAEARIRMADDALNEAGQILTVGIGAGFSKGAAAGAISRSGHSQLAAVTVEDNDPATVTIAHTGGDADADTAGDQVPEGGRAVFTVTLSPASAGRVTVPYTTTGAGLTADDYTGPGAGTLSFAPGASTAQIVLAIALDGRAEAAETLTVTLGAPQTPEPPFVIGAPQQARAGQVGLGESALRQAAVEIPANTAAAQAVFFAAVPGGAAINEGGNRSFTITRAGPALTEALTVSFAPAHVTTAPNDLLYGSRVVRSVTFNGAETGKTFTVHTTADLTPEADEEFRVELSVSAGALQAHGGVALGAPLVARIIDNEAAAAEVHFPDGTTRGEGEAFSAAVTQFRYDQTRVNPFVTRDLIHALSSLRLRYTVSGIGAGEWRDYGGVNPQNRPLPAGDGTLALSSLSTTRRYFTTVQNDLNEADRTMAIRFQAAAGFGPRVLIGGPVPISFQSHRATLNIVESDLRSSRGYAEQRTFNITITDDDPLVATFAESRLEVAEGTEAALTVNFDRASAGDITVPYTVTASDDLPPDYTDLSGGSIVVPAGQTRGVIRLRSDFSARTAGAGDLTVAFGTLSADSRGGRVSGSGEAVIEVRYSPHQRTFSITAAETTVEEGGAARFMVRMNGAPRAGGRIAFVNWAVVAGAGNASAADIGAVPGGALRFTDNAPQTIVLPVIDDDLNEAAETLRVALSLPPDAGSAQLHPANAAATVTIAASDPLTYRISGGQVPESAEAAVFTVHLSHRSADAVTFTVSAGVFNVGGTATVGDDFTSTVTQVTVAAGTLRAFYSVPLMDDNLNEADETIIAVLGETPTAGPLAGPIALAENGGRATATILDDDPITAAIAAPDPASAVEGGTAEFTVTLSGGMPTTSVRVFYSISGPDITGADYFDRGEGLIDFDLAAATADPAEAAFTVNIAADGAAEGAEILVVTITGGATGTGTGAAGAVTAAGDGATVAIAASGAATQRFAFAHPPRRIAEGAAAVFVVSRAGPAIDAGGELAVQWIFSAGDTTAADFSGGAPAGGTLTFRGAQTRASFRINTADDRVNEADETFSLVLNAMPDAVAAGAGVGAPVEVAVADDDVLQVTANLEQNTQITEGGGPLDITFGITAGVAASAPVEFTWALDAPHPGVVSPDSGVATIPVGDASVSVPIAFPDDSVVTGGGLVVLSATARSAGAVRARVGGGRVPINIGAWRYSDNDAVRLSIAADQTAVDEGANATFTVTSDHDSTQDAIVDYSITTLRSPLQFNDLSGGSVTIPAGRRSATISIATALSPASTGSGGLRVTLSNPRFSGATGFIIIDPGGASADTTVNYTAQIQSEFTLSTAPGAATFTEGRTYRFPVTLSQPPPAGASLSVGWAVQTGATPGSATAQLIGVSAADFCDAAGAPLRQLPSGRLRFADGAQQQNVLLRPCADSQLEPVEEFRLVISAPAPAHLAVIAAASSQTLRLNGAETPGVQLPARLDAAEGGRADLTITFTGGDPGPNAYLTHRPLALAGVAANEVAERPAPFNLPPPFEAGTLVVTSNPFTIPLQFPDDNINEATEGWQIQITFANIGHATTYRVPVRVADNDPLTFTLQAPNPATVVEGGDAVFAIQAAGGAPGPFGYEFTYLVLGDADSSDYTAPGLHTTTAGAFDATARIVLNILPDGVAEGAERLTVVLTSASATAGAGRVVLGEAEDLTASVTIAASAAGGHAVSLSAPASGSVTEGQSAQFTVTRSGPALGSGQAITVNWALAHGGIGGRPGVRATTSADFTGPTSGSVTFDAANPTTRRFSIATQGVEAALEGDEAFTVALSASQATLSALGGVILSAPVEVTLSDESHRHMVLAVQGPSATEFSENDTIPLTVQLQRSGNAYAGRALVAEIPLRIVYTGRATYGLARAGDPVPNVYDDHPANGRLTIPAGGDQAAATLRIVENRLNEPVRQLRLNFRLDPADRRSTPLGWATSAAGAPGYNIDYRIADNDPLRAEWASTADVQAVEGGEALLPVHFTSGGGAAASVAQVNLPYTVTASAGRVGVAPLWRDPGGGVLSVRAGATGGVIRLTLPAVPADSGDGLISVALGAPVLTTPPSRRAGLPMPVATHDPAPARIRVRYLPDAAPRLFSIAAASSEAVEEGGMARFTVTVAGLPPSADAPAAVNWRAVSGATTAANAADADDLMSAGGRVQFISGAPQTFAVELKDDALNEGAETLSVMLESPTAGGIDANNASASATIAASDPLTVRLEGGGVVAESAGAARFTVTLSGRSAGPIGVPLLFSGSATAAGNRRDVTAPAQVTVPAGAQSRVFEVGIVEDSAIEARETFTLTLGALLNPGPGAGPASRA
ncbi:MAG: hypothetical protein OXU96_02875, partial [Gammaproteobacteria bacterium]|nr:hypothetical protein [Gammaproteobacteria bacterium]